MKRNRLAIVVLLACAMLGFACAAYSWYYRAYTWPDEIQTNVVGARLVNAKLLRRQEGYSHYGEGMHRWYYNVQEGNKEVAQLCGNQSVSTCSFTKTRRLSDGVVQTVDYNRGSLILEEVWD